MTTEVQEFPKGVFAKKTALILSVILMICVGLLILFNFFNVKSEAYPSASEIERGVRKSNETETQWYKLESALSQERQAKEPVLVEEKKVQKTSHLQEDGETIYEENSQQESVSEKDELESKAMLASIDSNQINREISATQESLFQENVSEGISPGVPLEIASQEKNDQNRQSQKKAFLESNTLETNNYLHSRLANLESHYELKAGSIIPGILITGINSDLPGQITGQVRSNIYDTASGRHVLIPQGAKLVGVYDSEVTYGQKRVLVAWKRIIFPNGQSINLEGMPGVDLSGYAGLSDKVNNHYVKIFSSVLLLSVLSAGAQLSQPQESNNPFEAPSVGQTIAESVGLNLSQTGIMLTQKNINIQPTLEVRPGYLFNINVTKDMIFPGVYSEKVIIGNN